MQIIKNISWVFGANLIAAITKWLVLVLIARVLAPNDVGAYSLAFAIGAPITLFVHMKLRSLYVTERDIEFSNYLYSRNIMSLFALLVISLIGLFIYPLHTLVIILVGINKIYDLHSDLYYSLPQIQNDFNFIGKLTVIKHLIILIAFFISLLLTGDLVISLLIQCVIQMLFFYKFEKINIKKKYTIKNNKPVIRDVRRIILNGLPLGVSIMIISLNSNYPKYLLEHFESTSILGYFSAVSYVLVIGNIVMNSISHNFLPLLTKELAKGNINAFNRYVFGKLTAFSTILGLLAILLCYTIGEPFLKYMYGAEYVEFVDILILMGYAMAINFISWNFDTALMAMRYISIQPKIAIVSLIINMVIGFILVKDFGIYGAAYSIIIANIIQLILRATFVIYGLYKKDSSMSEGG